MIDLLGAEAVIVNIGWIHIPTQAMLCDSGGMMADLPSGHASWVLPYGSKGAAIFGACQHGHMNLFIKVHKH